MKILLSFVSFFLCIQMPLHVHAQNDKDSAEYYNEKGQYAKALPFVLKQFEATKKLEENNTIRVKAGDDVGMAYYRIAQYDSATVYFMKASENYKKLYGEKSQKYALALNNLGLAYKGNNQNQNAETLYYKSLAIFKELGGEDSSYAIPLINLGQLYFGQGSYGKAEEIFLKSSAIFKKNGEKTVNYSHAIGFLALVYNRIGNFAQAEKLQLQVLEIRKEILGENHPLYAVTLDNLGVIYSNLKNYKMADSLQRKALAIKKHTVGENNIYYLFGLHNLGVNSRNLKKYNEAESFYQQSIEGLKKKGEDNFDYLFVCDALANLYFEMGRKDTAELLFLKSLAKYDKMGILHHPYRLELLYHIIDLYLNANAPKDALKYLPEAMSIENRALLNKLDFLSESELLFYLQQRTKSLSLAEPYLFLLQNQSSAICKAAYNNRLLFTGISIQNIENLNKQISSSKDSTIVNLWKDYQRNKSLSYKLLSIPVSKRTTNADSLNDITNQQEKDLLRKSASYRNIKEKLDVTWQDVHNNLKPDEAAIEFVKFNYYHKTKTDTVYYAAMLIRPQDTVPQFVKLFEEKQLLAAFKTFAYKAPVRGSNPFPPVGNNQKISNTVYKLVWQPFEAYLTKIKTVYFSPDGLLHQLAFAAIPYKQNGLLCDRYNLVQVSSTRQVALHEDDGDTTINNTIALFGGINYNRQSTDTFTTIVSDPYAYVYQQNRGMQADSFQYLPNTLKEINSIKRNMIGVKKNAVLFTDTNATEQAFRSLGVNGSSPEIIHFATHGFTLPDTTKNKNSNVFQISSNPLLRCGLVMAGGNKGWNGNAAQNEDDGILTGLEISSVNLQNTQLAVLSACETGLGKVEGSEGVFGLQRAFKLAGVNYVMASLWPVPDKETAEFMGHFYTTLSGGKQSANHFWPPSRSCAKNIPLIIGLHLHWYSNRLLNFS